MMYSPWLFKLLFNVARKWKPFFNAKAHCETFLLSQSIFQSVILIAEWKITTSNLLNTEKQSVFDE